MDAGTHVDAPPDIAAIHAAAKRIAGYAARTPLLEFPDLNATVGMRVLLKAENLQRTGSFKFRGAFNCLAANTEQAQRHGVVAWSSGNHAQGVALAARELGAHATIVMPADAPKIKQARTRELGADIVCYDRYSEDREQIARALVARNDALLVPSYDHPLVIAGQGTVGLEMLEQADAARAVPDAALVCCGGGGLSAGTAMALHSRWPNLKVHTVEPAGFDDTARSLASGTVLGNDPAARSLCDALLTDRPGALTLPILKEHASRGLVVTDRAALNAVRYAHDVLKLVLEPGGAVALAAVLEHEFDSSVKTVLVVLSGGNIDASLLSDVLNASQ